MLDAIETLFFRSRHKPTIHNEGGTSVAVVGVDSDYTLHERAT